MDYKNLFAKESTVSVQIMKVDGKKLTAPLINQFKRELPFDALYNFTGEKIFGYVKMKMSTSVFANVIIAQKDGNLIQFRDVRLNEISRITEATRWSDVKHILNLKVILADDNYFYRKSNKEYEEDAIEPMADFLTADEISKIFSIRDRAHKFLAELYNHQIYI